MFLIDLIANRYTLGTAAVATFAVPVINETEILLTDLASTLSAITMAFGG